MEEPFSDLKIKILIVKDMLQFVGGVDLESINNQVKVP